MPNIDVYTGLPRDMFINDTVSLFNLAQQKGRKSNPLSCTHTQKKTA